MQHVCGGKFLFYDFIALLVKCPERLGSEAEDRFVRACTCLEGKPRRVENRQHEFLRLLYAYRAAQTVRKIHCQTGNDIHPFFLNARGGFRHDKTGVLSLSQ